MLSEKKRERYAIIFISFFAIVLIIIGIASLYSVELNYSNYWGGVVFAPIAIIVALITLFIIIFKRKELKENAEYLDNKSKHDNYKKW